MPSSWDRNLIRTILHGHKRQHLGADLMELGVLRSREGSTILGAAGSTT